LKNSQHNILIVTDNPFPVGLAATHRIIAYARGFITNGCRVQVICCKKTECKTSVHNRATHGIYRGIEFRYIPGTTVKSKYLLKRKMDGVWGGLKLLSWSIMHFNDRPVVIYYGLSTATAIILKLSSLLKGSILLKEENEHISIRLASKNIFSGFVFKHIHYHLFDGVLLITKKLIEYFQKNYPKKKIHHVPILVDAENLPQRENRSNKITYCGIFDNDGVDTLIKAFQMVVKKFPQYQLQLIGMAKKDRIEKELRALVNQANLTDQVIFRGPQPHEVVGYELSKSALLVLARPESIQAQYGFPTKLAEYLITSNPVVVTSVGEIPDYLKDNKNAYLAVPGDVMTLSEKIQEALSFPLRAAKIGAEGRNAALAYFNNIYETKKIIEWIEKNLIRSGENNKY